MNNFKDNLVKLRVQSGRTQQQIADILQISRKTYAAWEEGRCSPSRWDTVISIATFYKISLDTLMGLSNGSKVITENHRFFQQYFTAPDKVKKAIECLLEMK